MYVIILSIAYCYETSGGTMEPGAVVEEPACSLECKQLSMADYTDLLWTTLAEFPGIKTTTLHNNIEKTFA